LPPRNDMSPQQRTLLVEWVQTLADPIEGWHSSFDFTFGSGDWPGKRYGKRKIRRDMLAAGHRRGWDPDDVSFCFGKFMDRFAGHVTWFIGIEPNPDFTRMNPGFHGHGLLAGGKDVHRVTLQRLWLEEFGFSKVLPLRSQSAAVRYATKHLVRRGTQYAWKINSSTLWHHIKENGSDMMMDFPEPPRALVPFGDSADGRAVAAVGWGRKLNGDRPKAQSTAT